MINELGAFKSLVSMAGDEMDLWRTFGWELLPQILFFIFSRNETDTLHSSQPTFPFLAPCSVTVSAFMVSC
jgi:hypothetical protein